MTINTNMNFIAAGNFDDKITVTKVVNAPQGAYMERESLSEIVHNREQTVVHPTISALRRSGENHMMTAGSCTVEHWLDGSLTDAQIQEYKDFAASDPGMISRGSVLTYDTSSDKFTLTYTTEFNVTSWSDIPAKWGPVNNRSRITLDSGANFMCFLRTDGDPDAWTVKYKDIPAGTTSTIDKAGNICYVIFSTNVTRGSITLTAFEAYSVASSSFDVTAAEGTKVVRLHRD